MLRIVVRFRGDGKDETASGESERGTDRRVRVGNMFEDFKERYDVEGSVGERVGLDRLKIAEDGRQSLNAADMNRLVLFEAMGRKL